MTIHAETVAMATLPIGVSRRGVATCSALLAAVPIGWTGSGGWMLWMAMAAIILVSTGLVKDGAQGGRPYSILVMAPVAFVALLVTATLLLVVLPFASSVDLQRPSGITIALWTALLATWLVVSLVRGGRVYLVGGDGIPVSAGLAVLAVGLLATWLHPFQVWSRAVSRSTDFNRHLNLVQQVLGSGGMDYERTAYPQAVHGLTGVMWGAMGGTSYESLWRAAAILMWLMLVLLAISLVTLTVRSLAMVGFAQWWVAAVSAILIVLVLLQSMWITAFFTLGFLTSLAAGVVLAANLALVPSMDGAWFGRPESVTWLGLSGAVMCHVWTLLVPIFAVLVLGAMAVAWREREGDYSRRVWLGALTVLVVSAALCYPVATNLIRAYTSEGSVSSGLSADGYSGLLNPEWWWWGGLFITVATIAMLWRRNFRAMAWPLAGALVVGLFIVGLVAATGTGPVGQLNYYAAKTLWTLTVIVIPLSVLGSGWCLMSVVAFASGKARAPRLLLLGAVAAVLTIAVAGAAGRIASSPNRTLAAVQSGPNLMSLQLPVVASLEAMGIDQSQSKSNGVIVWGTVPNGNAASLATWHYAMADRLVLESTSWLGTDALDGNGVLGAVYYRRIDDACDYLRAHPDALRITGPNPEAGAPWFLDSGCPEDVVRPDQWISVPIDDAWFEGTPLAQKPYFYPTYEEFQAYLARQEAKRNQ
jgi:hypothetical protein